MGLGGTSLVALLILIPLAAAIRTQSSSPCSIKSLKVVIEMLQRRGSMDDKNPSWQAFLVVTNTCPFDVVGTLSFNSDVKFLKMEDGTVSGISTASKCAVKPAFSATGYKAIASGYPYLQRVKNNASCSAPKTVIPTRGTYRVKVLFYGGILPFFCPSVVAFANAPSKIFQDNLCQQIPDYDFKKYVIIP